jgi:hypothetical protein
MRAATFGSIRNTLGSVSIAVETSRSVTGHLIIIELIGKSPFEFVPPLLLLPRMELGDRDGLKTAPRRVDKHSVIGLRPGTNPCGRRLFRVCFSWAAPPLPPE